MKSSSMFIQGQLMLVRLEKYNTRKPITEEQPPPIKALFRGMDDLIVRASDTHTEKSTYAGNEQYQGI